MVITIFHITCALPAALKLRHSIPASAYESVLAGDDIVNVAAVIEDVATKERVLSSQEFSLSSPQITIEVKPNSSPNELIQIGECPQSRKENR